MTFGFPAPRCASIGALMLVSAAGLASAQTSGDGFLFRSPRGSFSVHGGYALARAGSDVFSEATSLLTLDKRDFSAFSVGGDISYALTPRFDLVFGGDYSGSNKESEYRDWVDNNEQAIQQSTNFKRVPLTLSLRYYLVDRGRSVSQFAWIPSKYSPYVGVGGGATWYRFRQEGDFVDFQRENEVFRAELESSGWAPSGHAMAGVDYTLRPSLALTAEGRYSLGKATLDQNVFQGFEKIDLAGFVGTVGFKVRF
jgi:opacity protein-like surface antigen